MNLRSSRGQEAGQFGRPMSRGRGVCLKLVLGVLCCFLVKLWGFPTVVIHTLIKSSQAYHNKLTVVV